MILLIEACNPNTLKCLALISTSSNAAGINNNNPETYFNDFENGVFYGYDYRKNYSLINGSICINYQAYNGIILTKFKCPVEGFNSDETNCCDSIGTQYCCVKKDNIINLNLYILILISSILLILIGFVLYIKCRNKPTHQSVLTHE